MKGRQANLLDEHGEPSETFQQILDTANKIANLRLIILDPMRRLFHGNEDSSDTASRLISLADQIAYETGATVLLRTVGPVMEYESKPEHLWSEDEKLKPKIAVTREIAEQRKLALVDTYGHRHRA